MALSGARLYFFYGLFLILGGVTAFAMAGFESKAKTALIMGGGSGLVMWLLSYLAGVTPVALKAARSLTFIFLVVFLWRGYKIAGDAKKEYLYITLMILAFGSAITLLLQSLAVRAQRQEAKASAQTSKKAQ